MAMRIADIRDLRQMRMETYIELHQEHYGDYPDDWHLFVRSDWELPLRHKARLLKLLREGYGWEIDRLQVKKARHPDGRLLGMGEFAEEYGAMALPVTRIPRLMSKETAPDEGKKEVKAG